MPVVGEALLTGDMLPNVEQKGADVLVYQRGLVPPLIAVVVLIAPKM
jgi:hypothetical protein